MSVCIFSLDCSSKLRWENNYRKCPCLLLCELYFCFLALSLSSFVMNDVTSFFILS
jgi:hypothetical protein